MGLKADGARDRRHVSGQRRIDVGGGVRDLERKRDAGLTADAGRATTGQWLEIWLEIAARRVRGRTLESYGSTVRLHLAPSLGHIQLSRLQPKDIEQLHTAMAAKGLSGATVLRAHRVLARALKVAVQRGRVARNVATLVDAPTVRRTEVVPLTPQEARRVLTVIALTETPQ